MPPEKRSEMNEAIKTSPMIVWEDMAVIPKKIKLCKTLNQAMNYTFTVIKLTTGALKPHRRCHICRLPKNAVFKAKVKTYILIVYVCLVLISMMI